MFEEKLEKKSEAAFLAEAFSGSFDFALQDQRVNVD